jgi:HlyD family secretion protein
MLAPNTDVQSILKASGGNPRWAFLSRRLFWALAAVAVVAVVALWWVTGSSTTALTYSTAPVKRGAVTLTVTATGTVQPINQVDVGSELSGAVRSVNVDFNDTVTAGEVLAVIDTDKLAAQANHTRAQLAAARANVVVAEATVKETDQALKRAQSLARNDVVSLQDLQTAEAASDRAVASLDSANAQVNVSEADLVSNESDLGKAQIRSPIGGVVLSRNVDPGQTVAASLQAPVLFTIAEDLSQMHLLVDVDEADAGGVKEGQDATFTVEAFPNKSFSAKVIQLRYASETVNGVVTYKAVLSADNASLALRPGMTATADIVVRQTKRALLIPNAALRYAPAAATATGTRNRSLFSQLFPSPPQSRPAKAATETTGEKRVYVLKNGEPEAVLITPGDSDGTFTVVQAGDLAEGDAVITDSATAK